MPALRGGVTKTPRGWYTPWQKLAALVLIACSMEEDGVNQTEVARRANVAQSNIHSWIKLMTVFEELEGRARSKKSCRSGPKSQLEPIKDNLLLYIFEMHETGTMLEYLLVLFKAASLLVSSCAKLFSAQYHAFAIHREVI
jgi:hypothetical protein